jgi:hypothetical protein
MNPYIVQGVTLVFYDGEREELSVLDSKITDRPPKLLKEQILDGFSKMENPPVKVELKIKWLSTTNRLKTCGLEKAQVD